jgi:acyl dehydratase
MSGRLIELYTDITADRNPLHYDEEAARASIFGGLIVQGGITSGVLNALVAEDLPGPGTVFLSMELKFSKAVYVHDTITGEVEVESVREDKPICNLLVAVRNQSGELCLSGKAATYTAPLRPSA